MPTIQYRGRWPRMRTSYGDFIRGQPVEVSQSFLDENRIQFDKNIYDIEGDVVQGVSASVDLGNDGIPDEGWTRKEIIAYCEENHIPVRAGLSKAKLIERIVGQEDEDVSSQQSEEQDPSSEETTE